MPSACVLTGYGAPELLEWNDVRLPDPSERQIRIEVHVSCVGPTHLRIAVAIWASDQRQRVIRPTMKDGSMVGLSMEHLVPQLAAQPG